jgi:hypothetical protein
MRLWCGQADSGAWLCHCHEGSPCLCLTLPNFS